MDMKEMDAVENDHDHEASNLHAGKPSPAGSTVKLRRELGLFSAVNLILGVMIGSGIFVSPATALAHAGSVGFCLVVWTVSGVVSLLGALSFAELGTVVGKSGAEYSYFQEAFGGLHKFWGPVPSFICAWVYVVILRPAEVAVIVMTFAEYAVQPFVKTVQPEYRDVSIKLMSLCALVGMTGETAELVLKDLMRQREEIKEGLRELRRADTHDDPSQECLETFRNGYQEALRREVELNVEPVRMDMLHNATEFNMKLKSMIQEREQMSSHVQDYTKKLLAIVNSLTNCIDTAREGLKRSEAENPDGVERITPQQVKLAREKVFRVVREAMSRFLKASFGEKANDVMLILKELLDKQGTTEEYAEITTHNFAVVNLLKEAHIVTLNPYKDTEMKLAF